MKISLYAARGPRNQTESFYCQRNAATRTIFFIVCQTTFTAHYTYRKLSESGTVKLVYQIVPGQDWLKYKDTTVLSTLNDIMIVKD